MILIVGAGIAGLMAARDLARAGKKVMVLEALDRAGGRIHTITDPDFVLPVELGAEFIHGKLLHTFELIKEYKLNYSAVKGDFFTARHGKLEKSYEVIEDSDAFEKKLRMQEEDISVNDFLENFFSDAKYNDLKDSVRKFVEGYDAADADKASVLALKKEWLNENWKQYRITGGYIKLIEAILKELDSLGAEIRFGTLVKEIHRGNETVSVKTAGGEIFYGEKLILTVPLGVLNTSGESHIQFFPSLTEKFSVLKHLGFGPVIKIVFQFNEAFWRKNKEYENIGFIFSDKIIPTWWSQLPDPAPVLTGWLGGPPVLDFAEHTDEMILEKALQSLSEIFMIDMSEIKSYLSAYHVMNWSAHKFSNGAYTYSSVNDKEYIRQLTEPVDSLIYFAGEGYYMGDNVGTVEAAIASAQEVVKLVLRI